MMVESQSPASVGSTPAAFDAIVVGSGMGALTCGALLSKLAGKRVLLVERHYRLGGFTHTFNRPGGRSWDVGLHYVGQMQPGEPTRAIMDLVTGGRVRWNPMPSPFERYLFPDFHFDQPVGAEAFRDALVRRWPREVRGIDRYFRQVASAARWIAPYLLSQGGPRWIGGPAAILKRLGSSLPLQTTSEVIDACVADPQLRAVLAAQWGDYGLPPGKSSFLVHAMIATHYFDGGWYPHGGAGEIAAGAKEVIESGGGSCLTNHEVESILVDDGRAVGVRVRGGRAKTRVVSEFHAPIVISGAGATVTFESLVPEDAAPLVARLRSETRRLGDGPSAVQLFLGFRESPRALGFQGENHWLFDGHDHDELYARRNELVNGRVASAYLSFPSLKDPQSVTHTGEIIAPFDCEPLAEWGEFPWKRRGSEYEGVKDRISEALISFVERSYPGFGGLVDYQELATPLSVQHFTSHAGGAIYGLPAVPDRYTIRGLGITTPIDGLLLTGSDVAIHGIVGAMMGGVATAAHVMGGATFFRIMADATRRARVSVRGMPADDGSGKSDRPAEGGAQDREPAAASNRQARTEGVLQRAQG
jgi:all-trans-retinol 13,14-reductase